MKATQSLTVQFVSNDPDGRVEIGSEFFGSNFLYQYNDAADLALEQVVDALGVSALRYPGGTMTEAWQWHGNMLEDDGWNAPFGTDYHTANTGFDDFVDFASGQGAGVILVLPTKFLLKAHANFLADPYAADPGMLAAFQDDIARVVDFAIDRRVEAGDVIQGFELGNEYWAALGTDENGEEFGRMDSATYGMIANEMLEQLSVALDAAPIEVETRPSLMIQSGTPWGQEWDTTLWQETWPDAQRQIIDALSDTAKAAVDQVIYHYEYDKDGDALDVDHGLLAGDGPYAQTADFWLTALDVVRQEWGADPALAGASLAVTEWSVKHSAEQHYGMKASAIMVEAFEGFARLGVEAASLWPIAQGPTNPNNTYGVTDAGEPWLSPTGATFRLMGEYLTGAQVLDIDVSLGVGGLGAEGIEVNAYLTDDALTFVVMSRAVDGVNVDLNVSDLLTLFGATGNVHGDQIEAVGYREAHHDDQGTATSADDIWSLLDLVEFDDNDEITENDYDPNARHTEAVVRRLTSTDLGSTAALGQVALDLDPFETAFLAFERSEVEVALPVPEPVDVSFLGDEGLQIVDLNLDLPQVQSGLIDVQMFRSEDRFVVFVASSSEAEQSISLDLTAYIGRYGSVQGERVVLTQANGNWGECCWMGESQVLSEDEIGAGRRLALSLAADEVIMVEYHLVSSPSVSALMAMETKHFGRVGDDVISGTDQADMMMGHMGDDTLKGFGGDDVILGHIGNDHLYGHDGADKLYGGQGDDFVSGGAGDDIVFGGWGNDTLEGGDGDDFLFADAGDDVLYSGSGDDYLIGGYGADQFIFSGTGRNTVEDYRRAEGDRLDLTNTGVHSFDDLVITDVILDLENGRADGALINYGSGEVFLMDVSAADLSAHDFYL